MNVKNLIKYTILYMLCASYSAHAGWDDKTKAFAVYPTTQTAYCSDEFYRSMDRYAQMGGNAVHLIIIKHQDNFESHELRDDFNTVSNDCAKQGANYAQGVHGLQVIVTARVDTAAGWRRNIRPANLDLWFENYRDFQQDVACGLSSQIGASAHSVGTEMKGVLDIDERADNAAQSGKVRWPEVVAAVRSCYGSTVTYSWQHMDGYNSAYGGNNDLAALLDVHGFSAYFPLSGSTTADLVSDWSSIRDEIKSDLNGKPYWFMEAGARPCSESIEMPYEHDLCTPNLSSQVLWWDAFLQAFADQPSNEFLGLAGGWAWEACIDDGCGSLTNYHPDNYAVTFDLICSAWNGSGCEGGQASDDTSSNSDSSTSTIDGTTGSSSGETFYLAAHNKTYNVCSSSQAGAPNADNLIWALGNPYDLCYAGDSSSGSASNAVVNNTPAEVASSDLPPCFDTTVPDDDGDGFGWDSYYGEGVNGNCYFAGSPASQPQETVSSEPAQTNVSIFNTESDLQMCLADTQPDDNADGECWNQTQGNCLCANGGASESDSTKRTVLAGAEGGSGSFFLLLACSLILLTRKRFV